MAQQQKRITYLSVVTALFAAAWVAYWASPSSAETARMLPPPTADEAQGPSSVAVVLAGGCFWSVQGVFQHVNGVISAVSGYAGGSPDTAHYEMTGSGTTGHAESVRNTFDPRRITYGRILQI
jgi:peptide-methionine (S)-S-oxide reductase